MSEFLMKEGEKYKDFALVKYYPIDELQSVMRELIHIPTGAHVMHLENDDPENLFCLSFKTLPENSNGVPHILEHTVLCGSRKYPVKDPFFSMNRRSLNTFMNALTGSDFTCYPAATQIEKDFYNLFEVYLDAVFHPKLHELSFLQEGHRLEFSDPKDPKSPLEFKGIVYNEMKGAMSSVDSRIWHALMQALVPDLTYAHNSGGDPKDIPSLTYEELISFHETYYHPSRCLFYFYGNLPLKKHLDFIEENALKGVPKLPPIAGIGHQERFPNPVHKSFSYPISKEEDEGDKHIYAFSWLTTPLLEVEEVLALTVLDSILMDTDASPLKKALLETKLCIQAESYLDVEMTEVPLAFFFRGCKENSGDAIEKALRENLGKIAREGIPYELVQASMHQLELSRTEIGGDHSPFGLTLFFRSGLAKQHGCNPEDSLTLHSLFQDILEKAKDPHFFSPLIEKYILHNSHHVRLSFAPDPDLPTKEAAEEKQRLKEIKSSLNEKQVASILENTKKLAEFQEASEDQKLDCLPKVTLHDVPEQTRDFPLQSSQRREMEIFHHDNFTNHLLYADLVFDLPNLSKQELMDLQLFIIFLPELGSANRTYSENLEAQHAYTGGIGAHASLHVQASDPAKAKPSLQLHGKALQRNAKEFFSLLQDMVTSPRFDEKERIKELVKKLQNSLQNRLTRNAMRYSSQIALSHLSVASYINELWYGLTFYNYVQGISEIEPLLERLLQLKDKLLCIGSPHLILSCDANLFSDLDKKDFYGLPSIPTKPFERWKGDFVLKNIPDQARVIPSPVAFTTQAFKTIHYTHEDAPALLASTALMENKVLHHRIREQGGAYGSGASYNALWGNFYFYGYRDPHIAHTVRCFKDAATEIAAKNFEESDLEEAKLGIIQNFDTPTSPSSRAVTSYIWARDGKTRQIRQDFRSRLLSVTPENIQSALEKHLLPQIDEGPVVTFAGQELLDKELPLLEEKKIKILPIT
ncbi:MAG: insulinase family protein [Simkaniaceae bacterium]|nr:insulinase family protein [Candidatus Sacchlamyda saccharinae]